MIYYHILALAKLFFNLLIFCKNITLIKVLGLFFCQRHFKFYSISTVRSSLLNFVESVSTEALILRCLRNRKFCLSDRCHEVVPYLKKIAKIGRYVY